MYNYSISKKHVNMIEIIMIIVARSNQLVIQLNSLASVPTPLGRTCVNRRSVQNGHSTLSPGNPEWPELTVYDFVYVFCNHSMQHVIDISSIDHKGPNWAFLTLKMTFRVILQLSYFRTGLVSHQSSYVV